MRAVGRCFGWAPYRYRTVVSTEGPRSRADHRQPGTNPDECKSMVSLCRAGRIDQVQERGGRDPSSCDPGARPGSGPEIGWWYADSSATATPDHRDRPRSNEPTLTAPARPPTPPQKPNQP